MSPRPSARVKTSRNSSEVTIGAATVCTNTFRKRRTSFWYSVHRPSQLTRPITLGESWPVARGRGAGWVIMVFRCGLGGAEIVPSVPWDNPPCHHLLAGTARRWQHGRHERQRRKADEAAPENSPQAQSGLAGAGGPALSGTLCQFGGESAPGAAAQGGARGPAP